MRALHQQGVALRDQIVTVAVTEVHSSRGVPSAGESWLPFIEGMRPGDTRVFQMDNRLHRQWCAMWFAQASIVLGMNLPFDVLWLRAQPQFRSFFTEDLTYIDLAVLNYLHSEARPERSLKNIVSLFNIDRYDGEESLKHGHRYRRPSDPLLHAYNARDSHNTTLGCAELARRIGRDHPHSDKGSDWCIRHYSDTICLCVGLSESGVPFTRSLLERLEAEALERSNRHRDLALSRFGLPLDGEGSQRPQLDFMNGIVADIDALRPGQPSILSDNRVALTKVEKRLSTKDINREVFRLSLPADHPKQEALTLWDDFKADQKLLSSYTFPLLRGARSDDGTSGKFTAKSTVVNGFAYPSWYPVPSPVKDGAGGEGGTEQGRFTAKNPAVQTLPKAIKDCIEAPEVGGSILWIDLSQIELRVAALLSGEPTLVDAFRTDSDLHTEQAVRIFGQEHLLQKYSLIQYSNLSDAEVFKALKSVSAFNDLERQCGKHDNFTQLNLGGADTLQKTILKKGGVSVPLAFCQKAVDARPFTRPTLYAWQMSMIEKAKREHVIYLPICGLSCFFSGDSTVIDETFRSKAVNFPIQTWAGLLMREFQIRIQKRLCSLRFRRYTARQFINIYDATGLYQRPGVNVFPIIQEEFTQLSVGDGLWARLQDHYGIEVPIKFDSKLQVRNAP